MRLVGPQLDFLRRHDARLLLLECLSAEGKRYEVSRLLDELASDRLLTRQRLHSLSEKSGLDAAVRRLLRDRARAIAPPPERGQVGTVLVPLVIRAHECPPELGADLVVPRWLCCVVHGVRLPDISTVATRLWREGLIRVAEVVSRSSADLAPRAPKNWARSHCCFDLERTDGRRDDGALWGADRSFELAAAVALLSAAFNAEIPGDTAAMGLLHEDGSVRPLGDTPNAIGVGVKCRGLVNACPSLRRVFVASEDEHDARKALPPEVAVIPVNGLDDIEVQLAVAARNFRGPAQRSRLEISTRIVNRICRMGLEPLDAFATAMSLPASSRLFSGRVVGELLGGAGVVGAYATVASVGETFRSWQAVVPWLCCAAALVGSLATVAAVFGLRRLFVLLAVREAVAATPVSDDYAIEAILPLAQVQDQAIGVGLYIFGMTGTWPLLVIGLPGWQTAGPIDVVLKLLMVVGGSVAIAVRATHIREIPNTHATVQARLLRAVPGSAVLLSMGTMTVLVAPDLERWYWPSLWVLAAWSYGWSFPPFKPSVDQEFLTGVVQGIAIAGAVAAFGAVVADSVTSALKPLALGLVTHSILSFAVGRVSAREARASNMWRWIYLHQLSCRGGVVVSALYWVLAGRVEWLRSQGGEEAWRVRAIGFSMVAAVAAAQWMMGVYWMRIAEGARSWRFKSVVSGA